MADNSDSGAVEGSLGMGRVYVTDRLLYIDAVLNAESILSVVLE